VGGLWVEKKIEEGVMGKMAFFLSEPNREGSRQGGRPVEGDGVPATQAMGTVGR
jgi:hypothetical protein